MGRRGVAGVLLLVLVAVGCTGTGGEPPGATPSPTGTSAPTPPPITGPQVAVVLPADGPGATPAAHAHAVERLRTTYADQLSEIRAVTPDDAGFTADIVGLLAEEGYDLVCVVGAGVVDVVVPVAEDYPRTRFCVYPQAPIEVPTNVLLLDLAVEQSAFVAGTVAVRLAPKAPPAFIGSRLDYAMDRRRAAFVAAATDEAQDRGGGRGGDDEAAPAPLVGVPADAAERAASFARTQFEAGARIIYSEAGPFDPAVREVAAASDGAVMGSMVTLFPGEDGALGGEPPRSVLLGFEQRLDAVLRVAVDRLLGEWSPAPRTLGFAEGVVVLTPGGHRRSDAALRIAEEVRAQIESGGLEVPAGP